MAFVEFGIACPAALARDRFGFFLTSLLPPRLLVEHERAELSTSFLLFNSFRSLDEDTKKS